MKLSKNNLAVQYANNKGYVVNSIGEVYNKNLNKIKLKRNVRENGKTYHSFNLKHNNILYTVKVHKLQAYQKYGEKIFNKNIVVRHLNDNSEDNSENNICIGTAHDNHMDMLYEKRLEMALNATKHIRKYTDEIIINIKTDHLNGLSYKELMQKYNISSKGTINYILKHKYKTKK